jgi:hypothetical protein
MPTQGQYAAHYSSIRRMLAEQQELVELSQTRGLAGEVDEELAEVKEELLLMLHERQDDERWERNMRRLYAIRQALHGIRQTLVFSRPNLAPYRSASASTPTHDAVPTSRRRAREASTSAASTSAAATSEASTSASAASWDRLINQASAPRRATPVPHSPDRSLCPVCGEREQTHVFCPCGHFGFCGECVAHVTRCLHCRREGSAVRLWRVTFGSSRRPT